MSFPAYEHYKNSEVDWLGEVPSHWDVAAIKHIVSTPVTDGPHETPEFCDEGVPFVSAEAVSSGEINFEKIRGYISQADHERYCEKYKPEVGDIYMVKSGASTGTTAIVEDNREFSIWSPLAAIRCDDESLPRFVLNFLRSRNFQEGVTLNWSFGTQQNIGMNVIENLQITRPPIDEQKAIASFLDVETSKIDGLVSEQRRLIELLKEKRQAVISHAVTKGLNPSAPMKPSGIQWLGDVPQHWTPIAIRNLVRQRVVSLQDGNHGAVHPKAADYKPSGIPFVMSNNMHDGSVDLEGCCFISEEQASKLRIGPSLPGDVLLSNKGTLGEVAIVPDKIEFPFLVLTPQITYYRIQMANELDQAFLALFLQSFAIQDQMRYLSSHQATRPSVSLLTQRELMIVLPPLNEQRQIASVLHAEVERFDTLLSEAKRAIELLQERRTALISAAVTGKIDVRGFVSEEAAA